MDDIYTFGKRKYVPADPIEKSFIRTIKNLLWMLTISAKCCFFGVFILLKSFVFLFVPLRTKDIQNKTALVTGGANGIGREIAVELAKCGCNIALVDVDVEGAIETVEELQLLGVKAYFYEADVGNYDEVYALKGKVKADLGGVDILVNNAGLLTKISLMQGQMEDIMRVFKVNLLSQYWTLRIFLPDMIARDSGHIVSIASLMALEAAGRAICYSSTKYGIRGLMDGLHDLIRMDKLNLNVTTIFPALVNTRKEFIEQFISNDGLNPAAELVFYTPKQVAEAAIDGILRNKRYVVMPGCFSPLIKIINFLPEEFKDLISENFKPKVRAEVNEPKKPLTSLDMWKTPEFTNLLSSKQMYNF